MPAGRPSEFKEEYIEQAKKLCKLGATDVQIANFFGVCEKTINNWKHEYPEFLQSLRSAKSEADKEVEKSLFQRAIGYTCKDTKFATWEGDITDSQEYDKNYPPDVSACIFWLKNRDSDRWKDKREHDHSSSDGSMSPVSDDQRKSIAQRILGKE